MWRMNRQRSRSVSSPKWPSMPAKFIQVRGLTRGISAAAEAKVDPSGAGFKCARPHCRKRKRRRRARQRAFPQVDGSLCHQPNGHNAPPADQRQEVEEPASFRCHRNPLRGRSFAHGRVRSGRSGADERGANRRQARSTLASVSFSTGMLENVAVPIEIRPPYLLGYPVDALPCLATEFRLIPGASRETWDAEIDASHFLWSPQLLHAGKSAPGPFEPPRIAVDDSDIGYPLKLQTERGRKSALATAGNQHIKDPAPSRCRGTVHSREG